MGGDEKKKVKEAFDSGYVTAGGPMVERFESALAERTSIPHVVATSGGTAALSLIFHELEVGRGDTVFCSDLTFIASIGPAVHRGAKPVFIDCEERSWTIDPDLLEEAFADAQKRGRMPKCVVAVDLYGQCCDYDRIEKICRRHGTPLVVDSAEALGARYKSRSAGDAGIACVFSFNGNKIVTTSGGGALLSRDAELAARAKKRSQQSRENAHWYEHKEVGYNYRLGNINAAIGLGQLEYLDRILAKKRAIFKRYAKAFGGRLAGMPEAPWGVSSRWLSVFLCPDGKGAAQPTARVCGLMDALKSNGIESRPVWKPMHLQPCFRGCRRYGGEVAAKLFANGICLPSGAGLSLRDQQRAIAVLEKHL